METERVRKAELARPAQVPEVDSLRSSLRLDSRIPLAPLLGEAQLTGNALVSRPAGRYQPTRCTFGNTLGV